MFDKLAKFLFDDTEGSMSFYKLYNSLATWQKEKRLPYAYELPTSISLDSDFWKQIIKLYKATLSDGHERAVSVYWAEGDLILSSVTRGGESFVQSKSEIKIAFKPSTHKEYYTKETFVDGDLYSRKDIYHKNLPKQIDIKYLFNMHTHPKHTVDGISYYGIFSAQDIKSLVNTNAIMTGLITDKFTLLFKTNKAITVPTYLEDKDITEQSLTEKLGFVIFKGNFNEKLYRFSSELNSNQS